MHIFHKWSRWEPASCKLTWPDGTVTRRTGQIRNCQKCGLQDVRYDYLY